MASGIGGQIFYTDPAFAMQGMKAGDDQASQARQFGFQNRQQGQSERGATARAQIAADASKYPATLQQQRFDTLFPTLQNMLSGANAGGNFGLVGGQSGAGPQINAGPIWNPGQIQDQVNSARASNDARTGTQLKGIQNQTASRGFAAGSPLQLALSQQAQQANMGANTQAGTDIRWNAAQGNAGQLLKSQQAQEQQFAQRMQEDIERRKATQQYQSTLAGVLASLR